jgi:reticulon-4-interacting protein 1, mitochondrial
MLDYQLLFIVASILHILSFQDFGSTNTGSVNTAAALLHNDHLSTESPPSTKTFSRISCSDEFPIKDLNRTTTTTHPTSTLKSSRTAASSTAKMRAIMYDRQGSAASSSSSSTGGLKIRCVPTPRGGRRARILVQTHAVGLNPVDAKDVIGDKLPHRWTFLKHRLVPALFLNRSIVGFDFAGTVLENHHAAAGFQRGDKVFGTMPPFQGTLAEQLSVPLDQICHMPSNTNNLSFVQAAALPLVGLTALQSLSPYLKPSNGSTTRSHSVLIVGASGGTGHVAVQVARNLGATHITALCSHRNMDFVKSCGATHVIDYTFNHNSPETLKDNLKEAPGHPYGVILDCVTSADARDCIMDYPTLIRGQGGAGAAGSLVTDDHVYLRLGGPSSDWIRAGMERLSRTACRRPSSNSSSSSFFFWPDSHEKLFWIQLPQSSHDLWQLQQWVQTNQLTVQVSHTVPFTAEAVQSALDELLQLRVPGKIVVQVIQEEPITPDQEKVEKEEEYMAE